MFYGLLNFYLYTMSFVYSPAKNALYGKIFVIRTKYIQYKCGLKDRDVPLVTFSDKLRKVLTMNYPLDSF